ncbi:MAG: M48 family metalloprotease [Planctomycetota bacterium]
MPRLLSLACAFGVWMLVETHLGWIGKLEPLGLVAMVGISALFGLRWSLPRDRRPWEATGLGTFLIPLIFYTAWMGLFGGVRLWQGWELPAILSVWIGLVPWLVIQFPFRYGEAALLGLTGRASWEFALRQTTGLLLGILPLALVAQGWDLGHALLPDEPVTVPQKMLGFLIEFGVPVAVLPMVILVIPRLLGAVPNTEPRWQAAAAGLWRGRGRAPRVLFWPTHGLISNAVAIGFGPRKWVLLSDRLLLRLHEHEIEAVLAHELSHLRRGHALSLVAGILGATFASAALLQALVPRSEEIPLGLALCALVPGLLLFVPASRTFEMQADLDAAGAGAAYETGLVGALSLLGMHAPRLALRHLPGAKRLAEISRCAADPARAGGWHRRARAWRTGLRALFLAGIAAGGLAGI